MPELKPCPFCGAQPMFDLSDVDEYGQAWDRLSCPSCYAYVERALNKDGTGSDVVERWNARTDARADRLEKLLRRSATKWDHGTDQELADAIDAELGA